MFVGSYNDRFFVHVTAVRQDLVSDLTDVLKGGARPGCVEDEHVSRRLSKSAEGGRCGSDVALVEMQVPFSQRILREFVQRRKVRYLHVYDAIVGHKACSVSVWSVCRIGTLAEFIVNELLNDSEEQ